MKKIILTLSMIAAATIGMSAQVIDEVDIETSDVQLEVITPAEPVKESKTEMKEFLDKLRMFNDEVAYAKAVNSLRRGYFVLVADYIQIGNMGYRHYDINPNSNFIVVQGEDAIVQFAFNTGDPGTNGLGGWTAKGKARNMRVKYKDNGDVFVQFQIVGSKVNATIDLTLYNNSKRALARVCNGGELVFHGELLPYRDKKHR